MPLVQEPLAHCAAFVQVAPLVSLATQAFELQYLPLPQALEAVDEHAPLPSHTGPTTEARSAEHDRSAALEHVVAPPGKKHCVSELPLQ